VWLRESLGAAALSHGAVAEGLRESEGLKRLPVLWCGKAKRFGFRETPQLVCERVSDLH